MLIIYLDGLLYPLINSLMTVTISMDQNLADRIRQIAERDLRSFSKQVSFFCAQGVRDLEGSDEGKSSDND
jgi:hypothetical protein